MSVSVSGPFFDGRAQAAVDAFVDESRHEIAQEAENDVRRNLSDSLMHPTGFYMSQIQTDRAGDTDIVNDSGVVYGPWLEGTSARNNSTRFRGYSSFRRAGQRIERRAGGIAERVLPPYLRRMNG